MFSFLSPKKPSNDDDIENLDPAVQEALQQFTSTLEGASPQELITALQTATQQGVPPEMIQKILDSHGTLHAKPDSSAAGSNKVAPKVPAVVIELPNDLPLDYDERVGVLVDALRNGMDPMDLKDLYRLGSGEEGSEGDGEDMLEVAEILVHGPQDDDDYETIDSNDGLEDTVSAESRKDKTTEWHVENWLKRKEEECAMGGTTRKSTPEDKFADEPLTVTVPPPLEPPASVNSREAWSIQHPSVIPVDLRRRIRSEVANSNSITSPSCSDLIRYLRPRATVEEILPLIDWVLFWDDPAFDATPEARHLGWIAAQDILRPRLIPDLGVDVAGYFPLDIKLSVRRDFELDGCMIREVETGLRALCREDVDDVAFEAVVQCIRFYDSGDQGNVIAGDQDGARLARVMAVEALVDGAMAKTMTGQCGPDRSGLSGKGSREEGNCDESRKECKISGREGASVEAGGVGEGSDELDEGQSGGNRKKLKRKRRPEAVVPEEVLRVLKQFAWALKELNEEMKGVSELIRQGSVTETMLESNGALHSADHSSPSQKKSMIPYLPMDKLNILNILFTDIVRAVEGSFAQSPKPGNLADRESALSELERIAEELIKMETEITSRRSQHRKSRKSGCAGSVERMGSLASRRLLDVNVEDMLREFREGVRDDGSDRCRGSMKG